MGDGGKGSGRRPTLVDEKEVEEKWNAIKEADKKAAEQKQCGCPVWSLGCCGAGCKVPKKENTNV